MDVPDKRSPTENICLSLVEMTGEHQTEYQSTSQISKGKKLSLKPTKPPAEIAGYSIQKLLGSGAFGEVWAGVDRKTGRRVAIKFYTRRSSFDVTLLSSEVEKLVFLAADRYVVQLLDVGWDASPPYYVMDYIENGSIEDELTRTKAFEVAHAVELFEEIAVGLMHLHGKGILHCDLKPGNVLLDQDLKPRLADFGQSRLSHEQSPALGTLYYMAPEQADLEAVPDARWDVYALGALFYTMLTGAPPYLDEQLSSELETKNNLPERLKYYREQIAKAEKPNEHRNVPGVDRALAEIIDRCIAADPKRRFSSVQSVLLALKQREVAHTRRPLFVLGILGPLLFLMTVGAFGYKLYSDAIRETDLAVTSKASESNAWVARFAAASAGQQIDEYFQAVNGLANNEPFQEVFEKVIRDKELEAIRMQMVDPHNNKDPALEKIRLEQFVPNKLRQQLEKPLDEINRDPRYEAAASWFVCDKYGTQIAAKYEGAVANTRGKNYSYRTYYTGEKQDLVDRDTKRYLVETDPDKRKHIDNVFLSAIFQSTANKSWKVAFSAPIIINGQFEGIVAVTVEMGSFVQFENHTEHYVMLVDNRPGEHQGIILEHPLFDDLKKDNQTLDERFSGYHLAPKQIEETSFSFYDPIGRDREGGAYRHRYMAATTDVSRTRMGCEIGEDEKSKVETGMVVVAVEKYDLVTAPVKQLGERLWWLSIAALLTVAVLILLLWLFLIRVIRNNQRRLTRSFTGTESSSSILHTSMISMQHTIAAKDDPNSPTTS